MRRLTESPRDLQEAARPPRTGPANALKKSIIAYNNLWQRHRQLPKPFGQAAGAEFAWANDYIADNEVRSARGIVAASFVHYGQSPA